MARAAFAKLEAVNRQCREYAARAEAKKTKGAEFPVGKPESVDAFENLFLRSGLKPDEAARRAKKLRAAYVELDARGSAQ